MAQTRREPCRLVLFTLLLGHFACSLQYEWNREFAGRCEQRTVAMTLDLAGLADESTASSLFRRLEQWRGH